jgi:hypothetical protein
MLCRLRFHGKQQTRVHLAECRCQAKGTARRTAAACDVGVPRRMES